MSIKLSIQRIALKHIIIAMLRQKYGVLMLVLQIAITFAVLSNGLFIIQQRLELIQRPSGIDESNTFVLTSSGFTSDFNPINSIQSDLADLRQMPNVVNAVATYSFPYSGGSDWHELQVIAGDLQNQIPAARYNLDQHGIEALGLTLIAGDNFTPNEIVWQNDHTKSLPNVVLLSASVAEHLFNTQDWSQVVGKTIYVNKTHPLIIKGIVQRLQAPWDPVGQISNSLIYPIVVTRNSSRYFIRTQPGQLNASIEPIVHYLATSNQQRMIRKVEPLSELKKQLYQADIAAINVLLTVITALTLTAAFGVAGAANLTVVKKQKQLGIHRALGANKTDILLQSITQNLLQSSGGVLVGLALALSLNVFLVNHYALSKLPWSFLLLGVALIYLIGLLATLKPSLKAMNIDPAQAVKTQ